METEGRLRMADVFVGIRDPRQAKKVEHDLVELLVIAVCGVLAGADDFVEIEEWAKEKHDWFRQYLQLEHGIPSHDTFGRVFAAMDAVNAAELKWKKAELGAWLDARKVFTAEQQEALKKMMCDRRECRGMKGPGKDRCERSEGKGCKGGMEQQGDGCGMKQAPAEDESVHPAH